MLRIIPNLFTLGNLCCGFYGILAAAGQNEDLDTAAYMIFIALICDFMDGFTARVLNAKSDMGRELDSLADLVTFGVLPGIIMFDLMRDSVIPEGIPTWLKYSAFMVPIFSAIRLAKFNIDTKQSDKFIGLPTPANALLVASLPLIVHADPTQFTATIISIYFNYGFYIFFGITVFFSLMLVAPISMIALKFKSFHIGENIYKYLLMLVSIILMAIFQHIAIPFVILLYIILSMLESMSRKKSSSSY